MKRPDLIFKSFLTTALFLGIFIVVSLVNEPIHAGHLAIQATITNLDKTSGLIGGGTGPPSPWETVTFNYKVCNLSGSSLPMIIGFTVSDNGPAGFHGNSPWASPATTSESVTIDNGQCPTHSLTVNILSAGDAPLGQKMYGQAWAINLADSSDSTYSSSSWTIYDTGIGATTVIVVSDPLGNKITNATVTISNNSVRTATNRGGGEYWTYHLDCTYTSYVTISAPGYDTNRFTISPNSYPLVNGNTYYYYVTLNPQAPLPTPTPLPPPPTLNSFTFGALCPIGANLSWSGTPLPANDPGCPNGLWVDISQDPTFPPGGFSNKCVVGSTTTTAPGGFNPAFTFNQQATYYARVFNGQHSNVLQATTPLCPFNPSPPPNPSPTPSTGPAPSPSAAPSPTPTPTPTPTSSGGGTPFSFTSTTAFCAGASLTDSQITWSWSGGVQPYLLLTLRNETLGTFQTFTPSGNQTSFTAGGLPQNQQFTLTVLDSNPNSSGYKSVVVTSLICPPGGGGGASPTPTPSASPTGICDSSLNQQCTTSLGPGCTIVGGPPTVWCQQNATPNSFCQYCPPPPPPPTCQSNPPPNDAPTATLRPDGHTLDIYYSYILPGSGDCGGCGYNPFTNRLAGDLIDKLPEPFGSFAKSIAGSAKAPDVSAQSVIPVAGNFYRNTQPGFLPAAGTEVNDQFGNYTNGLEENVPQSISGFPNYTYYQLQPTNGSVASNTQGVINAQNGYYPGRCSVGAGQFLNPTSFQSANLVSATSSNVTFNVVYTADNGNPYGTCGSICYGSSPQYLKVTRASNSQPAYLPWQIGTPVCTKFNSGCIQTTWTAQYTVDMPLNTADTFTIGAFSGSQCFAYGHVNGTVSLAAATTAGSPSASPSPPVLTNAAGTTNGDGTPMNTVAWSPTLPGQTAKLYHAEGGTSRWPQTASVASTASYNSATSTFTYHAVDDLANLPPATYYYGVELGNYTFCSYIMTDQVAVKWLPDLDLNDVASELQFYSDNTYTTTKQAFKPGETVYAQIKTINHSVAVSQPFNIGFYSNLAAPPSCSQQATAQKTINSLAVGGVDVWQFIFTASTTPGTYTAYAFADKDCQITESDETNNIRSKTYTVTENAWFQTIKGDVASGGTISVSQLPPAGSYQSDYLLAAQNIGANVQVNPSGYRINHYTQPLVPTGGVYNWLADRFLATAKNFPSPCNIPTGARQGFNYCSGNATLTGPPATSLSIYFIDGDLTITNNSLLNTAIYIVKGNITVASSVAQISSIFIAGGTFKDNDGITTTNQLLVVGAVYAQNVNLGRVLPSGNATTPADRFDDSNLPNFLMTLNNFLGSPNILWREVNP